MILHTRLKFLLLSIFLCLFPIFTIGQNIFCPCKPVCYTDMIGSVSTYTISTLSSEKFVLAYEVGGLWDGKIRTGNISNLRYIELGDPVTFFDGPSLHAVRLTPFSENRFLLTYKTSINTECRVCEILENDKISMGPPLSLSYACSPTVSISPSAFIIAFYDVNTDYGKCAFGSIDDGLEVSIDSVYSFTPSIIDNDTYISIDTLMSNKFIISYGGTNGGKAVIGMINEMNIISFSDPYEYTTNDSYYNNILGLDQNKFAIVYADEYDVMKGTVILGTTDAANNITFSQKYFFNESQTRGITTTKLTGSKIVVAYNNQGENNLGYLRSGIISGMNIDFAESQTLNENVEINSYNPLASTDSIHFLVQYIDRSDYHGYIRLCKSIYKTTDDSLTLCLDKSDIKCYGETNGTIDLSVSGGYEPYNYLWSNGDTSEDINSLSSGIYTVTVKDDKGTSSTNSIEIIEPEPIISDISIYNEISCPGGSNGAFMVTATGGETPYTYNWDGHIPSTFYITWGFYADTVYHVTIYDQNNCFSTDSAVLSDPTGIISKEIYGDTDVVSGEFSDYYVDETIGSKPDWKIEGGTILYKYSEPGIKAIKVRWGSVDKGLITLVETFAGGCTSDTARLEVIIDTLKSYIEVDSMIDSRDGRVYKTVKIGGQWWMQENLNIGAMINRLNQSSTNNGIIEKFCQSDDTNKCEVYGGLYSWEEMMDYNGPDSAVHGTTRGICPEGWHIPTDAEWKTLEMYLGLSQEEAAATQIRGEPILLACKLREANHLWASGTDHFINESGFTALPAGMGSESHENYGDFCCEQFNAYFWTSTKALSGDNYARNIINYSVGVIRNTWGSDVDFSVRCISDSIPQLQIHFIQGDNVCYGQNNGWIDLQVFGGIGPYTFIWSTGDTTRDIHNLSKGLYKVTVSDSRGDITVDSVELVESDPIITSDITGKTEVVADELSEYFVTKRPGSEYNWIVTEGSVVLGQTTNQVNVKWHDPGIGSLYVQEIDINGCKGDTVKLNVIIGPNTINILENNQILIYPNPADDRICIRYYNPDQTDYDITITDIYGKVCRVMNDINETELIIEKGNLQSGVYFIKLQGHKQFRGIIIFK